ncbi:MAG: aspartate:alanine exchanger family transporter [Chitinophagales bacterium]
MIEIFSEYPLLLLFVVASLGYLIGTIKIKGSSLGVAAVLFTGLAFGAIDPRLQIPEIIFLLGLSLFVYSIGLSSGPAFFSSYRKNGIRDFIFILVMLVFSGLVASGLSLLFGFSAATITGIYTGSTTNTAALAGVIDYVNSTVDKETAAILIQEAVVGYSFSYPMGVFGSIIAIVLMEKLLKVDYAKEQNELKKTYPIAEKLHTVSIEVSREAVCNIQLRDLLKEYDWNVSFGRVFHEGNQALIGWDTTFEIGDVIVVVGSEEDVANVVEVIGKLSDKMYEYDTSQFDSRRIFVSNTLVAGRTIAALNIQEKFHTVITRIRRGDIDMLANGDTVLEMGDRVRFIARREDLDDLGEYFGDSYTESSKVNLFSFGLGIGLGLILGSIEFSFGPTFSFKLGYAGGPLVVGLFLGAVRRTGPVVWSLPYSANVTLQQMGLILLLTSIGVRSGNAFMQSFSIEGIWAFMAGATISMVTAFATLLVGYKILKMPFSLLTGMVANQPAILDFATSRSNNKVPMFGYAMMFPIALISKILIAQILFLILY